MNIKEVYGGLYLAEVETPDGMVGHHASTMEEAERFVADMTRAYAPVEVVSETNAPVVDPDPVVDDDTDPDSE